MLVDLAFPVVCVTFNKYETVISAIMFYVSDLRILLWMLYSTFRFQNVLEWLLLMTNDIGFRMIYIHSECFDSESDNIMYHYR